MNADFMLLSELGLVQLTINTSTMFLTMPAKHSVRFSIGVIFLFTSILFAVSLLTGQINGDFVGLIGLAYLPLILWLFNGPVFQIIFAFFLQYSLTTLLISLAVATAGLFSGNENNAATLLSLMENPERNTDIVLVTVFILILFTAYIIPVFKYGRFLFQKLFTHVHTVEWALYSFGAVFSFAIMTVVRNMQISAWQHILAVFFILWYFMVLCFAIINTHEKTEHKYEAAFARDVIASGSGYYQRMNETLDTLRVLRHDYKYHLETISELLNADDKIEAEKYLTDIKESLAEKELPSFCSNSVLNALISSYSERCTRLNIGLVVEISMPKTTSVSNYEMCIVLGNLLENAVSACEMITGTRKIELIINTQGAHLAVMVKNTFDGEILLNNGQLVSKKRDGGIGLRSVKAVAAGHGGELMTEWDDTYFFAYVLLRLQRGE